MFLSVITLLVALSLSAIAAWYSIIGLTAIFASAVIPIIIMGGMLEVAKVVVTVWLHEYWNQCRLAMKLYLVPAVAMLMVITSMGIFGFLSKAHLDQDIISGDVQSKIAVYDEKIKTEKENIEANRRALKQMDEGVDQVLGRSTTEAGAEKAVAMRRSQQKERARLQAEISQSQKSIAELNDARAPIAAEVRKIEAEVGPIKYIAALIYGDNPDANLLERAVRWVIILLVMVFDPLAIMMVLASTESMKWERERRQRREPDVEEPPDSINDVVPPPQTLTVQDKTSKEPMKFTDPGEHPKDHFETPDTSESSILEQHPYLNKPFAHFENLTPVVYKPQQETPDAEEESDDHHETTPTEKAAIKKWKELNPHLTLKGQRFRHKLGEIDELPWMKLVEPAAKTGFGTEFPQDAVRGDTYIRTDSIPNRVFKHNGDEWIEVDKNIADSYTYDTAYIDHLISLLSEGQYDPDVLSESEREQIAQRLETKSNNQPTE
jgi:hypothetical protein